MSKVPNAQLVHIGLHCRDLEKMVDFYCRVFGLKVTDSGDYYMGGQIIFLSRDAKEHHQVVLATGRTDDGSLKLINQISFRVDSLEDLIIFYHMLVEEKVKEMKPRNHGNAWSIYFHDPEDNRIEIYTSTPWYVGQPFGQSLDLSSSADTIRAKTAEMVKSDPSHCPIEEWSDKLGALIKN